MTASAVIFFLNCNVVEPLRQSMQCSVFQSLSDETGPLAFLLDVPGEDRKDLIPGKRSGVPVPDRLIMHCVLRISQIPPKEEL